MLVVADTSPIHYLILMQHERLLPTLYTQVIIPPAVLREDSAGGAAAWYTTRAGPGSPADSKRGAESSEFIPIYDMMRLP